MIKRVINTLLSALFLSFIAVSVYAASPDTIITDPKDSRIEAMLNAIDKQNFDETGTNAEEVKAIIDHFIFTSDFKAIGGGKFPYPNSSRVYTSINDGFYKKTIKGATGCLAYARFVSKVIYDKEGEKKYTSHYNAEEFRTMLQTYAQAGDHIRSENNHSLVFISCTEEGFYTLDYINLKNQIMQLAYWKYDDFLNFKLYKNKNNP